jgi:hypothetical protein
MTRSKTQLKRCCLYLNYIHKSPKPKAQSPKPKALIPPKTQRLQRCRQLRRLQGRRRGRRRRDQRHGQVREEGVKSNGVGYRL